MSQTKYRKRMKVRAAVAHQWSRIIIYIALYFVMEAAVVAATVSPLRPGQVPTPELSRLDVCARGTLGHAGRAPQRLSCF